MREGWDTCRTSHGLSRALQRLLPPRAECVYEPERERMRVSVAEGGDPTPPPLDRASFTGWRGRWGHCNKANTHTHIFFFFRWLLCPRFSCAFPPPHFHLSKTCSHSSCLMFPPESQSVCRALPLPFIFLPSLSPLAPHPFLSDCTVILTCSH